MLRIMRVVGVSVLVVTAIATTTAAQEPTLDAAELEASCEANASDAVIRDACLYVVHTILVPGSGASGEEPLDPMAQAGVGAAQKTDTLEMTLVDFAWSVEGSSQPAEDHILVAADLRLAGLVPSAKPLSIAFTVSDQDGVTYADTYGCPEPCLGTDELGEGETREGWVAFEVPEETDWLELAYRPSSQADGLHWFVAR
jgi:hypothetical protein